MVSNSTATEAPLSGLNILLTRPEHDGEQWRSAFEQAGAAVAHIPTLAIAPVDVPANLVDQLLTASSAIFVSGNAVRALAQALASSAITKADIASFKQGMPWYAVGEKTEALAQDHGFAIEKVAASDSESLLSHESFIDIDRRAFVIVRGRGGREFLAETLRARGAIVNYCELYLRDAAWQNQARLASYLGKAQSGSCVVTASSVDALNYSFLLAEQANMQANIQQLPFLVPGARVAEAARQRGVRCLIQAQTTRLTDIVYELKKWWAEQQ